MRKMKFISIMIVSILLGAGITSVCTAEELDGEINVEVSQMLGLVSPRLDFSNKSDISLNVEEITTGNNTKYMVNDTITIDLNVTDNSDRPIPFLLPRSILYSAIAMRKPFQAGIWWPIMGSLKRLVPIRELFGTVNLVNSSVGNNISDQIEIPVRYEVIGDDPANVTSEEMTMYITVMGFLPADINGFDKLPIIDFVKIDMNISYVSA